MSALNLKTLSDEEINKFINSFDTVLSDCDGVLWLDNVTILNSEKVINSFRKLGKRVFYVTNNNSRTRAEFLEKCKNLNFEATEEEFLCTAYLVADYLKNLSFNKKVYLIGKSGIGKELDKIGIRHFGIGPDSMEIKCLSKLDFKIDPEVGAVIVGFDEHFNYAKMIKAASYLQNPDVLFIATNMDERFPVPSLSDPRSILIMPGTGSIVKCIETCSERKATVVGKPESYIANYIEREFKIDPERTLMIGDKANTDILLGTKCGFKKLLVLSGINSLQDVETWKQSNIKEDLDLVPDYYLDKLGDLLPYLEKQISEEKVNKHI